MRALRRWRDERQWRTVLAFREGFLYGEQRRAAIAHHGDANIEENIQ